MHIFECKAFTLTYRAFFVCLQVYMKLHELETQAKDDKLASQHERALQEYFVRTVPIGSDRYNNSYWSFTGDNRLFVQSRELLSAEEMARCPMPPKSGPDHDANLTRLFESRPNRYVKRTSCISFSSMFMR